MTQQKFRVLGFPFVSCFVCAEWMGSAGKMRCVYTFSSNNLIRLLIAEYSQIKQKCTYSCQSIQSAKELFIYSSLIKLFTRNLPHGLDVIAVSIMHSMKLISFVKVHRISAKCQLMYAFTR